MENVNVESRLENMDSVDRVGVSLTRVFAAKPRFTKFTKYDRLVYEVEQRRSSGNVNYLKAMCAMRWLATVNNYTKDSNKPRVHLSPDQIALIAENCFVDSDEESFVQDMDAHFRRVAKVDENAPVITNSRFAHLFS